MLKELLFQSVHCSGSSIQMHVKLSMKKFIYIFQYLRLALHIASINQYLLCWNDVRDYKSMLRREERTCKVTYFARVCPGSFFFKFKICNAQVIEMYKQGSFQNLHHFLDHFLPTVRRNPRKTSSNLIVSVIQFGAS